MGGIPLYTQNTIEKEISIGICYFMLWWEGRLDI